MTQTFHLEEIGRVAHATITKMADNAVEQIHKCMAFTKLRQQVIQPQNCAHFKSLPGLLIYTKINLVSHPARINVDG